MPLTLPVRVGRFMPKSVGVPQLFCEPNGGVCGEVSPGCEGCGDGLPGTGVGVGEGLAAATAPLDVGGGEVVP